jgi:hypothetical protein
LRRPLVFASSLATLFAGSTSLCRLETDAPTVNGPQRGGRRTSSANIELDERSIRSEQVNGRVRWQRAPFVALTPTTRAVLGSATDKTT